MDLTLLADESAKLLAASFGPIGTAAAGEIGSRLTGEAMALGKALWARVRGRLADPAQIEREAARTHPGSSATDELQRAVQRQLLQALQQDPSFAAELRAALDSQRSSRVQSNVAHQRIEGSVFGGTVSNNAEATMGE